MVKRFLLCFSIAVFCFISLLQVMDLQPANAQESAPIAADTPSKVSAAQESNAAVAHTDAQEHLGKMLSYWSVLPFIVILLSIAIIPLLQGEWWESHLNKGTVSVLCSLPIMAYLISFGPLGQGVIADILHDYYAFIVLLIALFTISGGIYLEGNLKASPLVNTVFLGLGALLASFIGTTGASMLLIRPLLTTNQQRNRKVHIFIFFTFLVGNIGGSLLPLGDPPLFLGYLFGVPFFWTLRLWPVWLTEVGLLLTVFYIWDTWAYAKETPEATTRDEKEKAKLKIHGVFNLNLIFGVLLSVIFLRTYHVGEYTVDLFWMQQPVMILLTLISVLHDANKKKAAHHGGQSLYQSPRERNGFTFDAILEVAILFIGIFITMTPAICLLKAHGAESGVTHAWQFFWMSGGLSSFLDNAPTYATYFALGQGVTKGLLASHPDIPVVLANGAPITEQILMAISLGSVFMGANSYIGNAPNFMIKSICEGTKVKMPSFFGYMIYSMAILIPSFLLIMFIYLL
ncbi:MAG: sodium:proton antiporter [Proteobacteria bacterium]|nr:sodium:proton antiporter [Pseudomonadota bacterium]